MSSRTMLRSRAGILASTFVLLLVATAAGAAPYDGLKCYKVKDSSSFPAVIDLRPADHDQFGVDANCKVKVHSRQLCFPVEADIVTTGGGPPYDVEGQDLAGAFLCYVLKCPAASLPTSLEMTDVFGPHTLTRLKASTVCTPAVSGVPVTTTTLPPAPPRQCANATAPNCDGNCGNDHQACVEDAGACVCQFQEPFVQCGLLAGAPTCYGLCPSSTSCVDVAGTCQCVHVPE